MVNLSGTRPFNLVIKAEEFEDGYCLSFIETGRLSWGYFNQEL